jgi:hypothetical protein
VVIRGGEEVDIAPSYAPIRCRGKQASGFIARVVKEAFKIALDHLDSCSKGPLYG